MSARGNLRTALILASIAIALFVGVIVDRWLNGG
ncbi:MAG: cytochrome oxidase small assembly protein [Burkholderiaceae bacterium]|nr:cytochrome oxidase small assembly protein [Burkholderiaceae bacterium]